MNKPIVIIPDACIPEPTVLFGYSGGMALYVANERSMLHLFEPVNVSFFAYITITVSKLLN